MDISFEDILELSNLLENTTDSLNDNEFFIILAARTNITRVAYRVFNQDDGLTPVVLYNSPLSKSEPLNYIKKISEYDSIVLRIYHAAEYNSDAEDNSVTDIIGNTIVNALCIYYIRNTSSKAFTTVDSSTTNTDYYMANLGKLIAMKKHISYYTGFMNLKSIHTLNSIFGNEVTGKFIQRYGEIVSAQCDKSLDETFALFGGDNFAFLIHEKNINAFLEFIKLVTVEVTSKDDVLKYDIACRVGVAKCQYDVANPSEALSEASAAYKKTRKPGAKDIIFSDDSNYILANSDTYAMEFKRDLESGKLLVYYQPIFHAENKNIVAAEALVRWRKSGEMVKPSEFLPMAEKLNLIAKMDLFVLSRTCENIKKWIEDGVKVVPISFNFSHYDLIEGNLSEKILNIVDSYGIDHRYIVVEFTDASYREELEALLYTTKTLRDSGIGVTIDNYGMGYSSLTLLQNIDIDYIKFNSSLIREGNDKMKILLEGLIDTTSKLGINVVTQGVMDEDIVATFRGIGCKYFQSDFFEKALSERFFTAKLNQ